MASCANRLCSARRATSELSLGFAAIDALLCSRPSACFTLALTAAPQLKRRTRAQAYFFCQSCWSPLLLSGRPSGVALQQIDSHSYPAHLFSQDLLYPVANKSTPTVPSWNHSTPANSNVYPKSLEIGTHTSVLPPWPQPPGS